MTRKTTFQLADGRSMEMYYFTGEVIQDRAWSETNVYSTTQPNYSPNSNGTRTTTVHSETIDKNEFWLRNAKGKETSFRLVNSSLKLRAGHHITMIWCMLAGEESGPMVYAYQHTTGQSIAIFEQNLANVKKLLKLDKVGFWYAIFITLTLLSIIGIPLAWVVDRWREAGIKERMNDFAKGLHSALSHIQPHIKEDLSALKAKTQIPA